MSSTVYWRGWKYLLLYWVSSALFTTEWTAKWQMTSERCWCKNRAANRGAAFFSSGWVQLARRKDEARFVMIIPHRSCIWRHQGDFDEMRSHWGGEDEVERRILWPWQHNAVETLPVQIVALLCCFCLVFFFPVITGCGHPPTRECSSASI